jgi:hypothetical protein
MLTGSALIYTVNPETSTTRIYAYTIIFSFIFGCIQQTGRAVAQAAHPLEKTFVAIGLINFAQIISVVCALSISNAVLSQYNPVKGLYGSWLTPALYQRRSTRV